MVVGRRSGKRSGPGSPVQQSRTSDKKPGQVRIIGGDWRRRVLRFPANTTARPTPDRVRETLFNWLGYRVIGARCLDLFSGTGALGMEALSRGAANVTFVDRDAVLLRSITESAELFGGGDRAVVANANAYAFKPTQPVDIVFVDPPYDDQALAELLVALPPHLLPDARVYVEHAAGRAPAWLCDADAPPAGWQVLRSGRAGIVRYHLLHYQRPQDGAANTTGGHSAPSGDSA